MIILFSLMTSEKGTLFALIKEMPHFPFTVFTVKTQFGPSVIHVLLPTESEEREVLGVGSISVAILPSRQYMKILYYDCTDMTIVG